MSGDASQSPSLKGRRVNSERAPLIFLHNDLFRFLFPGFYLKQPSFAFFSVGGGRNMMPGSTDLIENSKKRKQEISPRYEGQQVREVYKDFLSWGISRRKKNGVRKAPEVSTTHLGAPVPGVSCPPWSLSWKFLIFLIF